MGQYKTKKNINLTIDEKTWKEFSKIAKENAINKSQLIDLYLKRWIEKNRDIRL